MQGAGGNQLVENLFTNGRHLNLSAKLIELAKMAGVMHEADHAYSIWSTW